MPEPIRVQQPGALLAQLFSSWPGEKKKQIRTWLKFKAITVNGRPITQFDHPLKVGDLVSVRNDSFAQPGEKLTIGIRIIHEDGDVIVIEKPAGLLSIASATEQERTAYAHLMEHVRRGPKEARARVWIVHRLDKETSGLMVFAKTEKAKFTLQENWEKADKQYQAVVLGVPPRKEDRLESHLDESAPHKVFVTIEGPETRRAITDYRVIKHTSDHALLALTLHTGRRHQIRVQLFDLGFPIVGDPLYGPRENRKFKRLALHASGLRFPHPTSGQEMKFISPLPGELGALVNPPPRGTGRVSVRFSGLTGEMGRDNVLRDHEY